ncbi:MAG: large conductance mechanosensitive channel [Chloroflexota bacterium]|jgi:large conductance mechanosensitive channel|nr:large conductance mechanosensitive channel [Chloroflexota bacterium]
MKEFRAFLLRGNVVDLAVGVVIGTAFAAVVTSFVSNIMMPPIGKLTGGIDFSKLVISLGTGSDGKPVDIAYGMFLNSLITFVIVAAVVFFFIVKPMARLMPQPKVEEEPKAKECSECLSSIPVAARRCSYCGQPQKPARA